jgi:hypothetical protein
MAAVVDRSALPRAKPTPLPPSPSRGKGKSKKDAGGEMSAGIRKNDDVVVIVDPVGGGGDADPPPHLGEAKSRKRKRKTRSDGEQLPAGGNERDIDSNAAVMGSADDPPPEKSKGKAKCDKRFWCEFLCLFPESPSSCIAASISLHRSICILTEKENPTPICHSPSVRMLRSLEHYKEANGGSIEIPEMPPAAGDDGDGIPEANGGMFEMPELPSAGDGEGSPEAKLDIPDIPSAGDGESPEIPSAGDGTGRKEAKRLEKLRRWCESQLHHQRRCSMGYAGSGNLTEEKIEKLRGIGFRLAPSYDEMYERLVAARVGAHAAGITGPPEVDDGEDGELSEWAKEQKKMMARHSKGQPIPLSNDRIGKLISLGFVGGGRGEDANGGGSTSSENAKWDAMLAALENYKQERGTVHFPNDTKSLPKPEQKIKNWIGQQRHEFRKLQKGEASKLTAQRLQRLHSIGLELAPRHEAVSWADRMKSLREFVETHGHCKPKRDHPLASFVSNVRTFYTEKEEGRKSCLTDERVVSKHPPGVPIPSIHLALTSDFVHFILLSAE